MRASPDQGCTRAPLLALHDRHSTASGPSSAPPAATGTTWSAVRSAEAWPSRPHPGHHGPRSCTHASTTAARRSRSARLYPGLGVEGLALANSAAHDGHRRALVVAQHAGPSGVPRHSLSGTAAPSRSGGGQGRHHARVISIRDALSTGPATEAVAHARDHADTHPLVQAHTAAAVRRGGAVPRLMAQTWRRTWALVVCHDLGLDTLPRAQLAEVERWAEDPRSVVA
jgi:hypothetical protein